MGKDCDTCKHENLDVWEYPCDTCCVDGTDSWELREDESE